MRISFGSLNLDLVGKKSLRQSEARLDLKVSQQLKYQYCSLKSREDKLWVTKLGFYKQISVRQSVARLNLKVSKKTEMLVMLALVK